MNGWRIWQSVIQKQGYLCSSKVQTVCLKSRIICSDLNNCLSIRATVWTRFHDIATSTISGVNVLNFICHPNGTVDRREIETDIAEYKPEA